MAHSNLGIQVSLRIGALGALGLAVTLSGACAPKPMRPAPGAVLVDATAVDEQHGLLLFRHEPKEAGKPRLYLAKHRKDGPVAWSRGLDPARDLERRAPIRVVGGSALLTLEGWDGVSEALLHVTLDRGEPTTWTSTLPAQQETRISAVIGDAAQVFVFWTSEPAAREHRPQLEIAAFDQLTGERQWTAFARVSTKAQAVRLADGWLMYHDGEGDWELLRRRDGQRDAGVVVDSPGLCSAGGRWWAQRDDHLLALDLGGDVVEAHTTTADFIAPERRHQWSLTHCAESGDEVVLMVHQGRGVDGLLVGLDPATTQTRWKIAVPPFVSVSPNEAYTTPTRLGNFAVMGECAVDLPQRQVLGCAPQSGPEKWIEDGEDTLRFWSPPGSVHNRIMRISGKDGEVTAAIELLWSPRADIFEREGEEPALRGGTIWLVDIGDPGAAVGGTLQHLVLDARTLRPIERPVLNDQGSADPASPMITVRDILPELGPVFASPPESRRAPPEQVAINPLDLWTFGGRRPADAVAPAAPPAGAHERWLTMARASAELSADAKIHVLASRLSVMTLAPLYNSSEVRVGLSHGVLAIAEDRGPDGTRWVLLEGTDIAGKSPKTDQRSFMRRPAEIDIHRFIDSWTLMLRVQDARPPTSFSGVIDDQAWQQVTGAPRSQLWLY